MTQRKANGFKLAVALLLLYPALASGDEELPSYTNTIGMTFIRLPAGFFTMGSDKNFDAEASRDEQPPHQVTITQPFFMGKYEVTQSQWVALMGTNPSSNKGRSQPVEQVNWMDVQEFIRRLNTKENTGSYRLPTEAEWEYAARAGTDTTRHWGDSSDGMEKYAWFKSNSGGESHAVGQLLPNAWGLYDMLGNVWEWVSDLYDARYYSNSPAADPKGPTFGSIRVRRGGGWFDNSTYLRSSSRFWFDPGVRYSYLGFRLVKQVEGP
ncbi:MAG: formylglycine-generating enzyme family protein [Magnetococcales bacterium]|nr:formylglycine-generating enzyme family protein [Magnetococcales bacterium]